MKWKETIEAIKPTAAVQLSESIPLSEPASKKRRIATTRVMSWAKKCEACDGEHATSDANCEWIPPMLTTQATRGFLDVFSRNENTLELANGLACLKLSGTAPSFLYAYSVPSMLAAMLAGVQFIESPLPWELADKGVAMVFALPSEKEHFGTAGAMAVEIDLNDDMYTLDIGPLCAGCNCYTCKRHNRAYIHHLLSVQEMNSTILLAIHNMQRIVCMFREARKLNGDKKALSSFVETLITQF